MLCMNQLILIGVLIFSIGQVSQEIPISFYSCLNSNFIFTSLIIHFESQFLGGAQFEWLNNHQQVMKLVISDPESHPIYYSFEMRFSEYFNEAYFESLCSEDPSSAFILKYVDDMCPQSMSQSKCALSERKKELCDTTCYADRDNDDASDDEWMSCCPSEEECNSGNLAGCPFQR